MFDDLRSALNRQPGVLVQDFAGAAALVVIFVGALSLPMFG